MKHRIQNMVYSAQNVKYIYAHISGRSDSEAIYKKMCQNKVQEFLERLLPFEDRSNFV